MPLLCLWVQHGHWCHYITWSTLFSCITSQLHETLNVIVSLCLFVKLAHIDPRAFPDWIPDGIFPDGSFENGTHSRGCTPWEQDSIACALNFNWLDVTCCSDSLCNNQKTVTRTTTTDIATTTIVNEAAPARATVSTLLFFIVTIQLMW